MGLARLALARRLAASPLVSLGRLAASKEPRPCGRGPGPVARVARRASGALAVLVAFLSSGVGASGQPPAGPGRADVLTAARTVIAKARYATFITLDDLGHPQARIVDPFPPEEELTIWVATNARTRKVAQIGRDARVTLLYFDKDAQHFVTVIGTAAVVRDLAEKAKRWKPEWAPFYPNGYTGDDYLLVRVRPTRLEIVAPSLSMDTDPTTWRPRSLTFP